MYTYIYIKRERTGDRWGSERKCEIYSSIVLCGHTVHISEINRTPMEKGSVGATHLPQRPNLFFLQLASRLGIPRTSFCKELTDLPPARVP